MHKRLSIGYQLYSAREDVANDMEGTLAQLADMNYQGVEFAGFFDHSVKDIHRLMKKTGLTPISSHVQLREIRENPHAVIAFHQDIGCPYIAVPSLSESDRPGSSGFAAALQTLYTFGRLCKKHEITLLYHNHDVDFAEVSGQAGLDFILDAIPANLLQTELDTCWVRCAGADPVAYLRKYAQRSPLVHVHDFEGVLGERPPYALTGLDATEPAVPAETPFMFKPVGYGCQDMPALIEAAKFCGTRWLIVEQDESLERPPLEAARMSVDYLLSQNLNR
ncbi:MAG: sugar phosphate isomerase/epimerase [Clostridia bacterium]